MCIRDRPKPAKKKVTAISVTSKNLEKYQGVRRFDYGRAEEQNEIGLVTGLAWTEVGGDLLQIEVSLVPGKGGMTLTGQLGDVMKESASAALSVVRSRAESLGIDTDFLQKQDVHLHVPDGATPKDGPSAGIAMATALVSTLTKNPVRANVAMTGEITLRGRVSAIGGLKEKPVSYTHLDVYKRQVIPRSRCHPAAFFCYLHPSADGPITGSWCLAPTCPHFAGCLLYTSRCV